MKRRLFFLFLRLILAVTLVAGLLTVWLSFQSFETLTTWLGRLAPDGKIESFNLLLYQTLRLPLMGIGIALGIVTGTMLFRWEKTRSWIQVLPTQFKHFFSAFVKDAQTFLIDAKAGIISQGQLTNLALLGALLVATVVRLANMDISLGHDEAYMYNAFASRSLWHIISNYHLPNNHVLLSIIIKVTTSLLGNHVWSLRLPTVIAGILMVPAAYFFGKRFYSQETGLLGALMVAVFPILVQYSVLARGYIIIGLASLLLFILGDYVRVRENRFAWALIVVLSALGFFTIPIMLFPFGALYIWLFVSWIMDDTRSYVPKLTFLKYWLGSGISAALITILLYTPIMIYSFDRFFGNGFIAPVEWELFPITLWTRLRNTWAEWTLSIPTWIVLIGVFGFLISLIFHKKVSKQKFPPQIAFLLWIVVLLLVRRPDMLPRFWLFLAAPLLVWSAAGIVEPLKKIPFALGRNWYPARIFISICFIFVLAQSLWSLPSLPSHLNKKDEIESATIFLKDVIGKNDLVTANTARLPALRYYFDYYGISSGYIRQAGNFNRAFVIVDDSKLETLADIAPQLGFGVPAINMQTVEIVYQRGDFTIFQAEPAQ